MLQARERYQMKRDLWLPILATAALLKTLGRNPKMCEAEQPKQLGESHRHSDEQRNRNLQYTDSRGFSYCLLRLRLDGAAGPGLAITVASQQLRRSHDRVLRCQSRYSKLQRGETTSMLQHRAMESGAAATSERRRLAPRFHIYTSYKRYPRTEHRLIHHCFSVLV